MVPLTDTEAAIGARPVIAEVAELGTAAPVAGLPVADTGVTSNLIKVPWSDTAKT